jgi:membrane protease YdiL (CAAX protease family)
MTDKTHTPRSIPQTIFFSPDEPRLRAGWRLLIQTLLFGLILIIVSLPLSLLSFFNSNLLTAPIVSFALSLIAITGSVFIARVWLDRRSITSLGLKLNSRALIDILVGILIAALMMGAIYLIMLATGWLTFEGFAWEDEPVSTVLLEMLILLLTFVFIGWSEELLSRGYHLQNLEDGLNTFWGVLLSSAIFGILHLINPGANWASTLGILFAGLFLAYGYLRTRQLWLPIGLHIGWNFFEGAVFGFPVSGLPTYQLLRGTVEGPLLWTGGIFGPEGGLILFPGLALGAVLIYAYTRQRLADSN